MYGDKRDYPKIEIFVRLRATGPLEYVATTTWSKTCREARTKYIDHHPEHAGRDVVAHFKPVPHPRKRDAYVKER